MTAGKLPEPEDQEPIMPIGFMLGISFVLMKLIVFIGCLIETCLHL
jgi:hypothetical protein